MEDALFDIAKGLAPSLLAAAGRRVRDEALGDAQERALERVFGEATSVMLVEVARHDLADRGLPDRLAADFGKFYRDTWVAETLVGAALNDEVTPLEKLRRRFGELGLDPGGIPMDFGEAMRLLARDLERDQEGGLARREPARQHGSGFRARNHTRGSGGAGPRAQGLRSGRSGYGRDGGRGPG